MDTREYFFGFTARKIGDWSQAPTLSITKLSLNALQALKEKGRVIVSPIVGPFDNVFTPGAGAHDIEFILIREFDDEDYPGMTPNVEAYYVDTEGYNYSRYCVRLDEEIIRELKIEGRY